MTKRGAEVVATLSTKEKIVAAAVATGRRYRPLAQELGTTEQVIKNCCKALFDKTGTNNRLEFVLFMQYHGIINAPAATAK